MAINEVDRKRRWNVVNSPEHDKFSSYFAGQVDHYQMSVTPLILQSAVRVFQVESAADMAVARLKK